MGSSQEPGLLWLASDLPTTTVRFASDQHPSAVVVLRPVAVLLIC
jgi:hypothetical protein